MYKKKQLVMSPSFTVDEFLELRNTAEAYSQLS